MRKHFNLCFPLSVGLTLIVQLKYSQDARAVLLLGCLAKIAKDMTILIEDPIALALQSMQELALL